MNFKILRLEIIFVVALFPGSIFATQFNCSIINYDDEKICANFNLELLTKFTKVLTTNLQEPWLVTSVYLTSEYMFYLPKNAFSLFPNVTEIRIFTAIPQLMSLQTGQFEGLGRLKKVFIMGQRIKVLQANTFKGTTSVTNLFLPSNQIELINEKAFNGLINCIYLLLSNNRIKTLGANTFMHMTQLWSVNLENNRLQALSENHFANNNLTILDLSYNQINFLPMNVVENFISTSNEKKLFSLRGNLCNDEIFTMNDFHEGESEEDRRRIMKSLKHCFEYSSNVKARKVQENNNEDEMNLEISDDKMKGDSIDKMLIEIKELRTENDKIKKRYGYEITKSSVRTIDNNIEDQPKESGNKEVDEMWDHGNELRAEIKNLQKLYENEKETTFKLRYQVTRLEAEIDDLTAINGYELTENLEEVNEGFTADKETQVEDNKRLRDHLNLLQAMIQQLTEGNGCEASNMLERRENDQTKQRSELEQNETTNTAESETMTEETELTTNLNENGSGYDEDYGNQIYGDQENENPTEEFLTSESGAENTEQNEYEQTTMFEDNESLRKKIAQMKKEISKIRENGCGSNDNNKLTQNGETSRTFDENVLEVGHHVASFFGGLIRSKQSSDIEENVTEDNDDDNKKLNEEFNELQAEIELLSVTNGCETTTMFEDIETETSTVINQPDEVDTETMTEDLSTIINEQQFFHDFENINYDDQEFELNTDEFITTEQTYIDEDNETIRRKIVELQVQLEKLVATGCRLNKLPNSYEFNFDDNVTIFFNGLIGNQESTSSDKMITDHNKGSALLNEDNLFIHEKIEKQTEASKVLIGQEALTVTTTTRQPYEEQQIVKPYDTSKKLLKCENNIHKLEERLELAKTWYRTWQGRKPLACNESTELKQLNSMITALNNEVAKKDILLFSLGEGVENEREFEEEEIKAEDSYHENFDEATNCVRVVVELNKDLSRETDKNKKLQMVVTQLQKENLRLKLKDDCETTAEAKDEQAIEEEMSPNADDYIEGSSDNDETSFVMFGNGGKFNKKKIEKIALKKLRMKNDKLLIENQRLNQQVQNLSLHCPVIDPQICAKSEHRKLINKLLPQIILWKERTENLQAKLKELEYQSDKKYKEILNEANSEENDDNETSFGFYDYDQFPGDFSFDNTDCEDELRKVTDKLIHVTVWHRTWSKKKPPVCNESMEVNQLLKMVAKLNKDIEKYEILLAHVGEGVRIITKEKKKIEKEKQIVAEENYDLKQEIADFNILHQIDVIHATSADCLKIDRENLSIEEILEDLKESSDEEVLENDLEFDDEIKSFKQIQSMRSSVLRKSYKDKLKTKFESLLENPKEAAKEISEKVSKIVYLVSKRNDDLENGDNRLDNIIEEISGLIQTSSSRRTLKHQGQAFTNEDNLNVLLIDKAGEINLQLVVQKHLLHNKKPFQTLIDETKNLLLQDADKHESLHQVRIELEDLKEAIDEKDTILERRYKGMEDFILNVETARADTLKAKHDLERTKEEVSETLIDRDTEDAIEDVLEYADMKNKMCIDEQSEKMELIIGEQMADIENLSDELKSRDKKVDDLKKSRKDLLVRCESCRSSFNRGKGQIMQWFGKKPDTTCDFL